MAHRSDSDNLHNRRAFPNSFEKLKAEILAAVIGMKLPTDVCVGKSSPVAIWWLKPGRGRKLSEKRSATFARFAISIGEIKSAVLR